MDEKSVSATKRLMTARRLVAHGGRVRLPGGITLPDKAAKTLITTAERSLCR